MDRTIHNEQRRRNNMATIRGSGSKQGRTPRNMQNFQANPMQHTQYQQTTKHVATWRSIGTKEGDPIDRQHFDQIDFILTPARWRNVVKYAGSDMDANIDSDHAPVWAKCQFKLKQLTTKHPTNRTRVEPLEESKK